MMQIGMLEICGQLGTFQVRNRQDRALQVRFGKGAVR